MSESRDRTLICLRKPIGRLLRKRRSLGEAIVMIELLYNNMHRSQPPIHTLLSLAKPNRSILKCARLQRVQDVVIWDALKPLSSFTPSGVYARSSESFLNVVRRGLTFWIDSCTQRLPQKLGNVCVATAQSPVKSRTIELVFVIGSCTGFKAKSFATP